MSLSKHALTFLKRHYRALLQRAYVLGRAATAWCRFSLIPAPHSAQPAPAYRRRPKLTVPMLVAITALTCGPGLETAVARTTLTGNTISSGTYNQGLEINSPGSYTVDDDTKFQNVNEIDDAGALYLPTPAGNYGLTFAGTAEFSENFANINGGAIYTQGNLTITGGSGNITFSGNSASLAGGAIYTQGNLTIRAGSGGIAFVNNHADINGGAIYTSMNVANITLTAAEGNITFSGNTAVSSADNAVYMDTTLFDATINLQATDGHYVSFDDAIDGTWQDKITAHINQGTDYTGAIKFSTSMTLGQVTQHNGTFELSGTGTTLTSNYTLNQGTYEVKDGATGSHETFEYHGGDFKLYGTLDVTTFNQNGGALKAGTGADDNLNLGTNGRIEVDDYQLKNGSLTLGDGADKLAITKITLSQNTTLTVEQGFSGSIDTMIDNGATLTGDGLSGLTLDEFSTAENYTFPAENSPTINTFKLLSGGNFTVSAGESAEYKKFVMEGDSLTVEEQGSFTVTESFTHTDGTIVLKPKAAFTVAKGDYISPKYGSPTTVLELSSGSKFEVSSGSYTLSDGATVKVSGLGSSIKAQTIALNLNSTLHFTLDDSVYGNTPDKAMLSLNQTAADATAISLDGVKFTVDSATSTAAKRRAARTGTAETVHLIHSNKGFTGQPSDRSNKLYKVTVTDGESYRYDVETATPAPDPDTGGTDPGQGGTNPGEGTTPPGSGGDGSGGDSLVAVRDPQGLARLGATGNQARAFTILENGTFAADSPEERYFKAKGGIFEVTQQDGTAGLNALTALLPNDAPVVLDQARHTMSFITQAAFDSTELPQARLSATARGAVQDDGGRISAPLSLNSALWLKARLNNLESERYDSGVAGYEGDLSVLALGIDTALTDKWLLGLGFSYSKGDLDALSRSVESEGYSLFTYGRYRSGNWYVNGLVAVSLEDYDEDSQVLTQRTTADYRATTLYGGIFTGLELSTAHGGTFSPELGLTVLSTKLSDYDSDFSSDIEAERATISSALAGFKWQLQAISTEAAELTLQGSLHARYDLSTAGVDYTVGLSNGTQLQLTGEEPDRFAVMPSLGVSLKLGQSRALELEARYSAELSEHFTGQAVSLGLSYRF